ncbi:MAG: PKD domain-containing protein [Candidatus Neomarinimicrobiota bacterium]
MGKFIYRFITLIFISIMLSCSGGSSTQSVEDVGDDTSGENSGGTGGGVIPEPVASFTVSSYGGEAPFDITFTSTSTGEINSWLWNVDDDADYESNYYSFTHTYETSGTYDVSLIVTGPGGQSTYTQNDAITITEPETNVETGLSSQSMMYDNENREYLIYIPQDYNNNNSPMPILFAFHGFGGYSQYFINTADFRSLADQYNFIIVYPQALICNGGTTWNTNPPGGDNKCSQDDIGFFGALLYELIGNYNIDSSRVFLTGYSNGADFSYSMACFQSSLITAIAPVSGLMPMYDPSECSPSHATSVLIVNGTNDGSRPYNGIEGYMMSVDSTISYWAGYNNADSTPEVITEGNIERYLYANGDNDTEAILLKVVNGGHDWFDMTLSGLSFEQIIWQFFSNN